MSFGAKNLQLKTFSVPEWSLCEPGGFEPLFDIDTRNDDVLWEMWIEGFVQAMDLAPDG